MAKYRNDQILFEKSMATASLNENAKLQAVRVKGSYSLTTSAMANLRRTAFMRTFTSSPTFAPGTKTTKPCTRAIPSPPLPRPSIFTVWVSPTLTGAGGPRSPLGLYTSFTPFFLRDNVAAHVLKGLLDEFWVLEEASRGWWFFF